MSCARDVVHDLVLAAKSAGLALIAFAGSSATFVEEPSPPIVTWVKGRLLPPKSGPASTHRHDRVHGWIGTTNHEGRREVHELDWPLDREGRFREQVQEYRACGDVDFWFEFQDERGGFETGFRVGLPGFDDLPEPFPDEIDLGELEFPVVRTIAKGRVVSTSRAPIAGASVSLIPSLDCGSAARERVNRIESLERINAITGADGSFDLAAPFPVPLRDCQLCLFAPRFLIKRWDIPETGAVECVLIAEAWIEGVVDLDPATELSTELGMKGPQSCGEVEVVTRLHDSLFACGDSRLASIDPDGHFRIDMLEAGDVDVRVLGNSREGEEVLRWIPHVTLRAGEPASDPRLRKLAFRRAPNVRLRIVSQDEERGLAGTFIGVDERGNPTGWSRTFGDGEATIRPPTDVLRVEVRVEGFRAAWIEDVKHDATIHLRPGIPLKIVVAPTELPCHLDAALVASKERKRDIDRRVYFANDGVIGVSVDTGGDFVPPGMGGEETSESDVGSESDAETEEESVREVLDPDAHPGVLFFTVADPGTFELVLLNGSRGGVIPIPRESAVLDVKESEDVQVFEIHLDPDVVRSLRNE